MFYHRQKEIGTIRSFFTDRKHALLVYGKRRVGKTTLINKALEDLERNSDALIHFMISSVSLLVLMFRLWSFWMSIMS